MQENFDDLFTNEGQYKTQGAPQYEQLSKEDFAAKMKAEREKLLGLAETTATSIAENSESFQSYLKTLSRFERYSAHNTLLIHAQKPDAVRLGSYDSWHNAGTPVAKGAKGISIYEPGKEYERDDGLIGVSMNIKKVFDISQTYAKNKPAQENTHDIRTLLKAIMNNSPVPIKLADSIDDGVGARYDENQNMIFVEKGLDGNSLFRCITQEVAYAYLYKQDAVTPTFEDIGFIAHATSYTLCEKYGIDTKGYDFSEVSEYFRDKDSKEVIGELKTIGDMTHEIAGRMAKELNPPQKDTRVHDAR